MAEETSDADKTLEYFQRMYKGEEIPPRSKFQGLGSKCDECGYKD